jgi:ankyrin repeat protein
LAAFCGNDDCARLLLAAGADVNYSGAEGTTALLLASDNGHGGVMRILLKAGAEVNAINDKGCTALLVACANDYLEGVTLLIEAGADVNYDGADGFTALLCASVNGHTVVMRSLLEADAEVLATGFGGHSALSLGGSRLDVVQLLCAYGAAREALHPTAPADCRRWVLKTSAWTSELHHIELLTPARVRQLLVDGADVHASDGSGFGAPTPLSLARALLVRDPAHEGASLVVEAASPWLHKNYALARMASWTSRGRASS